MTYRKSDDSDELIRIVKCKGSLCSFFYYDRVFLRAGVSGFQLKTSDGAINPESLRELVDSDDRLHVIEGDAEMTINRKLRTDLSLTIVTASKKLKLSHYRKRLTRGRGQSLAIGTMAQYSDDDDDES
ncbi:MAG: hypothetical protein GY737_29075 [Desulfobacteraceae bacterium]|nr:hypothetical protein [Desulfobacteraceae bacterium]